MVIGPYDWDEIPFPQVRVNPMSVQPKPNGSGRIVMDFSAPHLPASEVDIDASYPISLNASINKREFKVLIPLIPHPCLDFNKFTI